MSSVAVRLGASLFALAVAAGAGAAAAQVRPLPSREELSPAERAPAAPQASETGVVGRLPAGPCAFETSDVRFTLQSVDVAGATAVDPARLAGAWEASRGREVPVAEICRIRDRVAELLIAEGVLARVDIPPQRIEDGRVRLEVIEAWVSAVRVEGAPGPALAKVRDYVERLQSTRPFRLAEVQRQILLASDVPGVRLSTSVRPSDAGRGAVELVVRVTHDPADAVVAVHNFGSEALGPWTVLARADFNSLTRFGERTSLVVATTTDFEEQRIVQLLEEVRLGSTGLLARGSLAWAETEPGDVLTPLQLEGESFVGTAEIAYPLVRVRRRSLWLSGGLEWIDQSTDVFGGAATLVEDEIRVAFARLESDRRTTWGTRPVWLSAGLEVRKGLEGMGASEEGDPNLSRLWADPQAAVLRGDARLEVGLTPRFTFAAAALTQWTTQPLVAYEELAIGNLTIGRGYDPAVVSGDRGSAIALEARFGPFQVGRALQASVFGFYDTATVETLDPGAAGEVTLASAGGGLRLRLSDRLNLELTYAHPFDRPFPNAPRPDERLLVNLVARLW